MSEGRETGSIVLVFKYSAYCTVLFYQTIPHLVAGFADGLAGIIQRVADW